MRFEREEEERLNNIKNENGLIYYRKLDGLTDPKTRDINDELVREHFLVQDLGSLLEKLRQKIILKEIKFKQIRPIVD